MNASPNMHFTITDVSSKSSIFGALGNEIRLRIVLSLAAGPKNVKEICSLVEVAQPIVSQQLTVLKAAGVVRSSKQQNFRIYELNESELSVSL
jgi:ArsR family transcriptional regulator